MYSLRSGNGEENEGRKKVCPEETNYLVEKVVGRRYVPSTGLSLKVPANLST